jgi:hypothetical protein
MYETQYTPCPGGSHPETFRLWESLEAGAIPVLVRAPALQPVEALLGTGAVWLNSWAELPEFLLSVDTAETASRAAESRSRFGNLRRLLMLHLARVVCLLRLRLAAPTNLPTTVPSASSSTAASVSPQAAAVSFQLIEEDANITGDSWPVLDRKYVCPWIGESDGHEVGINLGGGHSDFHLLAAPAADLPENGASTKAGPGGVECALNLFGEVPLYLLALLGRAADECGCRFRRRGHLKSSTEDYPPHSLVALDLGGRASAWAGAEQALDTLARMARRNAPALQTIGVLYLRDELRRAPPAGAPLYANSAFSFHQSWRQDLEGAGAADASYLYGAHVPATSTTVTYIGRRLYWLPLGCRDTFHARPILAVPAEQRQLLWSWAGAAGGGSGADRAGGEVMEALEAHSRWPELLARGRAVDRFSAQEAEEYGPPGSTYAMRHGAGYRALLYASQYVPCPAGPEHHETHRLWESLEAGAIPVLVRAPALGAVEGMMGAGVVWLSSWAELPGFLLTVGREETARRGSESRARYLAARQALSAQLARSVCQLRPPAG